MVKITSILQIILLISVTGTLAELSPEKINEAYHQSYTLEKAQNYLKAIEVLTPVIKSYPNGYTINYRMGWLTYLQGNYANALNYYRKALAVYPASVEVLNCISLVHKARLDWKKVEEENYKILKIDYFNLTANYWYIEALQIQKKYEQAEKVCHKVLAVYPTAVNFLYLLGVNCYQLGKKDEARSYFGSVYTLDPYNVGAKEYLELLIDKNNPK